VPVISVPLAIRLRDAGLRWEPARGDRFVIPGRGMDTEVFVLSDMTVEVHQFATGPVIGFNGTVEWALDSVEVASALWLPDEPALRDRLAGTFVSLRRDGERYTVELTVVGRRVVVESADPAEAYGLALLHLITGQGPAEAG
jgi:hypothetical protein